MSAKSATVKPPRPRRRSRARRILIVLLVLVILIIAFVALLPALVSAGLGQGIIRSAIAKNINGGVSLGDVSLSWTGQQSIRGFTITDPAGAPALTADVAVNRGLLSLITDRSSPLEIAIDASAKGEIREDGSTSFGDLFVADASKKPESAKQDRESTPQPIELAGVPPTTITITSFTADLLDRRTNQAVTIGDVSGELRYTPGGATGADLEGTASGAYSGSFKLAANADNLFDATGRMAPRGVPATLDLTMQSVPLPGVGIEGGAVIDDFRLAVSSADLTDQVQASITSKATIGGGQTSTIFGALTAEQILTPEGALAPSREVSGRITGEHVPMAPFQPFLAESGIVLARDVGELADFELSLARGEDMEVGVMARGDRADAEFAVDLDHPDERIHLVGLTINAHPADPALVEALSGLVVDQPVDAQLKALDVAVPSADAATGVLDKRQIGATGTLLVKGPATVLLAGDEPRPVSVSDVVVNLESARLGEGMRVYGEAMVEGGAVTFDQMITDIFDAEGRIAAANATPVGRVSVNALPRSLFARFVPGQEAMIDEVLGEVVNLEAVTSLSEGNLVASVTADSGALDLEAKAMRLPGSLRVEVSRSVLPLTPRLAAALQEQGREDAGGNESASPDDAAKSSEPISLLEPAMAQLVVEPFEIQRRDDGSYDFDTLDLKSHLTIERLAAEHVPALAEAVALEDVEADVTFSRQGDVTSILAIGRSAISRVIKEDKVAGVRFDVGLTMEGGVPRPRATIEARNVDVAALEPLMGQKPGRLTGILGDRGDVTATIEPLSLSSGNGAYRAAIDSNMPRLQGRLGARMDDQFIDITAEQPRLVVAAQTIEDLLAGAPHDNAATRTESKAGSEAATKRRSDEGASSNAPSTQHASLNTEPSAPSSSSDTPLLRVNEDLTLVPTIAALRLPRAMFRDEPFDPATIDVNVALAGSPLSMTDAQGTSFSIHDLNSAVTSDDLRAGISFTLTGRVESPVAADSGAISVEGRLHEMVTDQNTLARTSPRVELNARTASFPSALADSLGTLNGLLVAAIGQTVDLAVNARNFSKATGALMARLDAPNGWLEVEAKGRENGLRIAKGDAVDAELEITPPLRERLLAKISPILADIRTTKNPLTLHVRDAFVPLDGDVARLDATIEIAIGEVELDGGSTTLSLLKLFQERERGLNVPGFIEPIRATISDGVLTYDRFAVRIDKFTLAYAGTVNLVTRQVDLRTEIPLSGLALAIEELEVVKDLNVPIVTRGTFDNLKTQIDPSFNVSEAAVQGGLGGILERGLEDLLKRDAEKNDRKDDGKKDEEKKEGDGKKKKNGQH